MSEPNGNGATNGHPASLGDVLGRVSKLETSVAKLETGMVALQNDMHRIETGQGQILNAVSALNDRQSNSGKTNWMLVIGIVGVSVTFVTALGGLFISPLRAADSFHERDIAELRARVQQDHDTLIRMQERESLRREMGK